MLSVGVKKVLPVVVVSVCQRRTIKWTNVIIIMSLICILFHHQHHGFLTTRITMHKSYAYPRSAPIVHKGR